MLTPSPFRTHLPPHGSNPPHTQGAGGTIVPATASSTTRLARTPERTTCLQTNKTVGNDTGKTNTRSTSPPQTVQATQASQQHLNQACTSPYKFGKYLSHLLLILCSWLLAPQAAIAGISYQLDAQQAVTGQAITLTAVLYNDSNSVLAWTPPQDLTLAWQSLNGHTEISHAQAGEASSLIELPVNNFVKLSWHTTVPANAHGLQTVSIEGEPVLLAVNVTADGQSSSGPKQPVHKGPALAHHTSTDTATSTAKSKLPQADRASPGNENSAFERFRKAFSSYEPIYFDIGARNGADARFQISFKYRLRTPQDPLNAGFFDHWYLGYTQTSLWDLAGHSKPFVDTTYNPALFWQKDRLWEPANSRYFVGLAAGVEHRSNGKSGADSRSLNSLFIEPQLYYRFAAGSTLSFAPRIKNYFAKKENPDYAKYMGYVDWKLRWAQDNGLVLDAHYRQGAHGRYRAQLQAAWPLRRTFLNMNGYVHLQYFKGYGETLLGYREKSPGTLRIGLALVP